MCNSQSLLLFWIHASTRCIHTLGYNGKLGEILKSKMCTRWSQLTFLSLTNNERLSGIECAFWIPIPLELLLVNFVQASLLPENKTKHTYLICSWRHLGGWEVQGIPLQSYPVWHFCLLSEKWASWRQWSHSETNAWHTY